MRVLIIKTKSYKENNYIIPIISFARNSIYEI